MAFKQEVSATFMKDKVQSALKALMDVTSWTTIMSPLLEQVNTDNLGVVSLAVNVQEVQVALLPYGKEKEEPVRLGLKLAKDKPVTYEWLFAVGLDLLRLFSSETDWNEQIQPVLMRLVDQPIETVGVEFDRVEGKVFFDFIEQGRPKNACFTFIFLNEASDMPASPTIH